MSELRSALYYLPHRTADRTARIAGMVYRFHKGIELPLPLNIGKTILKIEI